MIIEYRIAVVRILDDGSVTTVQWTVSPNTAQELEAVLGPPHSEYLHPPERVVEAERLIGGAIGYGDTPCA
jgi:hypothetical protein